jgi:inositol 1,4,5-triphosphate receptor type 1/inositol 1,4,5-triphosphate receptor type 3
MYIVSKKDSTEYTGLEYWISDKIQKEDISWFPMINTDNNAFIANFDDLRKQITGVQALVEERVDNLGVSLGHVLLKLNDDKQQPS